LAKSPNADSFHDSVITYGSVPTSPSGYRSGYSIDESGGDENHEDSPGRAPQNTLTGVAKLSRAELAAVDRAKKSDAEEKAMRLAFLESMNEDEKVAFIKASPAKKAKMQRRFKETRRSVDIVSKNKSAQPLIIPAGSPDAPHISGYDHKAEIHTEEEHAHIQAMIPEYFNPTDPNPNPNWRL